MTGLAIDGWVGALVAVFILRAGWGAAKDTINPLLGQNPDPELVRNIQTTVLSHPQVTGMHDLIIHDYGPGRSMMSFHAEVPIDSDIMEAHDVIDHIERELKDRFGIEDLGAYGSHRHQRRAGQPGARSGGRAGTGHRSGHDDPRFPHDPAAPSIPT